MKVANSHILLFINNCTAHVSSGPQKHKINFLPGKMHKQASADRPRSNTKSESPLSLSKVNDKNKKLCPKHNYIFASGYLLLSGTGCVNWVLGNM